MAVNQIAQPYDPRQFAWLSGGSGMPVSGGAASQTGMRIAPSGIPWSMMQQANQVPYGTPYQDTPGMAVVPGFGGQQQYLSTGRATAGQPGGRFYDFENQPSPGSASNATFSYDPSTGQHVSHGNNIYANPYFGNAQSMQSVGGGGVGRPTTATAPAQSANWRDAKRRGGSGYQPPTRQGGPTNAPPYTIGPSWETPMPNPSPEELAAYQSVRDRESQGFAPGQTTKIETGPAVPWRPNQSPDFPNQVSGEALAVADGRASPDAYGNIDWQPQSNAAATSGAASSAPVRQSGTTGGGRAVGIGTISGYRPGAQQAGTRPTPHLTRPRELTGLTAMYADPQYIGPRTGPNGLGLPGYSRVAPDQTFGFNGAPVVGPRPAGGGQVVGIGTMNGYNGGVRQNPTAGTGSTPGMIGPPLSGPPASQPGLVGPPLAGPPTSQPGMVGPPLSRPTALQQGSWMNQLLSGLPRSGVYRTQYTQQMPTQRSVSVNSSQFMY